MIRSDNLIISLISLKNEISGLYNLGSRNATIKEIAQDITSLIPTEVVYQDIMFEDKRNYKVNLSKYMYEGWSPRFGFNHGVRNMARTFLENRIKDTANPMYHNANHMRRIYG